VRTDGIRAYLTRDLESAVKATDMIRAQRRAMAASIAGVRAELAMLSDGGPPDLTEITRSRLIELVAQMETFDREVAVPAENRRHKAQQKKDHFESFVARVIAA
jgi:hypothetical protein